MTTFATTDTVNGLLKFQGSDAKKFLQGQVTCDIEKLDSETALPGAFCSPKGRVRASFIIFQLNPEKLFMLLPKQQITFLMEVMAPYVAFFQTTMTDASDEMCIFGLLKDDENPQQQADLPWSFSHANDISSIKLPGDLSRWYCFSPQPIDEYINNCEELSALQWQVEDMKSGLVWINEHNRDKFLPHDLSLPSLGAVSFNKGCYTGQEIVARMEYRGTPKYILAIITTESTSLELPDKLIQIIDKSDEIKLGNVIDKVHLQDDSYVISASIKRILNNDEKFYLSLERKTILCNITIPNTVEGE